MLVQNVGSRASNTVLAQHFVLGVFADLKRDFGCLLKNRLFLGRTLLFAGMGPWDARPEAALSVLQGVGWWKRLGRLAKHVRRLGRLGKHVRTRLGRLARRRLLGWLVGWLHGWLVGW